MIDHRPITPAWTDQLIAISRAAGAAIMAVYNDPASLKVQTKGDNSPLTAADLAAHTVIQQALPQLLDIPLISEEGQLPAWAVRQSWPAHWLIDPLDGTKEFIARNGEFTVNIALIVAGKPLVGVVHLPVTDITYLGVDAFLSAGGVARAEKYQAGQLLQTISCRSLTQRYQQGLPLAVLVSHRHGTEAVAAMLATAAERWPAPITQVSAGSSLKFCLIAEGAADFYPRLAPTCEWDTAAAHAVLSAAGGALVRADNHLPLKYHTGESMLNPSFLAFGDPHFNWAALLA